MIPILSYIEHTLIFHNLVKNSTIEFMFSLQYYVATTIALTLLDQWKFYQLFGIGGTKFWHKNLADMINWQNRIA